MGGRPGRGPADRNQTIDATVLDPDQVAHLGKSTFAAKFGLGPLVSVDGAGLALAHVEGFVPKLNAVQPFVPVVRALRRGRRHESRTPLVGGRPAT